MGSKQIAFWCGALLLVAIGVIGTVYRSEAIPNQQPVVSEVSSPEQAVSTETPLVDVTPTVAELRQAQQLQFAHLVEIGDLENATQFAAKNNLDIVSPLLKAISQFRTKPDVDPQAQFNVLDYFLKHGRYGVVPDAKQLRSEYLRLVDQLDVPDSKAAFIDSTNHLYDLDTDSLSLGKRTDKWQAAFQKCVSTLETRPEDTAAWYGLDRAMGLIGHKTRATSDDIARLQKTCRTPLSRIRLANLVASRDIADDQMDQIIEAALPELITDAQQAKLLYSSIVRYESNQEDSSRKSVVTSRILESYPTTKTARSVLRDKLSRVAARDVAAALSELRELRERLRLTPAEIERQEYWIAVGALSRLVNRSGTYANYRPRSGASHLEQSKDLGRERDIAIEVLDRLVDRGVKFGGMYLDLRIRVALSEADRQAIDKYSQIWLEKSPVSKNAMGATGGRIAPELGRYYSSIGQWQRAYESWKRWPASFGGCGSWVVFPSEIRQLRLATCQLHLQEYEKAIDLISKGLADHQVDSRGLMPLLVFHLYRRAGQTDDFWKILAEWNANKDLQKLRSMTMGSRSGLTVGKLHSCREKYTLLIEHAEKKNWAALIEVCRAEAKNASAATHSLEYRYGVMLDGSDAALASVLLSEAGAESVAAIKEYYRELRPIAANEALTNEWWVMQSLSDNQSDEAESFLKVLAGHGSADFRTQRRRSGAHVDPAERLAAIVYQSHSRGTSARSKMGASVEREDFAWKSPPKGSLPKQIPLTITLTKAN